jgi:hypothetical protein
MRGMTRAFPLFLLALCTLFWGCELINPAEELPAYISVQNPKVVIDESTGFMSEVGLRNVWLYHGGYLQGVYQLDPTIDTNGRVVPFLQVDRSDFFLEGGIYESGQAAFQISYPFWDRLSFDWQGTVGDTHVVTPVFHYIDPSLYLTPVNEHFDGGSIDFERFASGLIPPSATDSSTFFVLRTDDVFHGNGAGHVLFDASHRYFETINGSPFFTEQSSNIFVEVTYKSTIPFTVGMVYVSNNAVSSQEIITVSPSGNWNTIYVHMITEVRKIINTNGPDTQFYLWLKADGGSKEGYIRFDDVRVIRQR